MIEAIKRWWCKRHHHGIINVNSLTYECARCFRITYHGLNRNFKPFPVAQSVSIKTPRRRRAASLESVQKVRSIA